MKYIVEITALTELNSKFDLSLNLPKYKEVDLLFNMYHLGVKTLYKYCKTEYLKTLHATPIDTWQFYLKDLEALLTQVNLNNYHILYNDIYNLNP